MSGGLAFLAGSAGALAFAELARGAGHALLERGPRVAREASGLVDVLVRIGREGRDPGALERRRLLLAGAAVAWVAGLALAGPAVAFLLAGAAPLAVSRVLRARRERYRRAVDSGVAALALAVADALGGGHSLRGALSEAAPGVDGAAGFELRRCASELVAGATTEEALEAMRSRVRSERLDTVVAACLLQSRAGGDLARLLRETARAFEEGARLEDEVGAATAQARFTGLIVVLLPVGGGLLAELASPGWFAGLWSSFLTAWLVGLAILLQAVAAVAMRRLARVPT